MPSNYKFERLEWLPDLARENATLIWRKLPWKKIERQVFKLQKRIYRAALSGNKKLVRKLQKTMVRSWYAKLLSVRRVTQENKGRNTAGVDKKKSLTPKQRIELSQDLKLDGTSSPTRRVWIPKPGKKELRPLGIPNIKERAKQTLLKLALEPEWEAKFEINSYGFRPGRSCHDAIRAIFLSIVYKPKYVLDADISHCFDCINHSKLLEKINTQPAFKRQIKAWLKSGVIDFSQWAERKGYNETVEGTPQGGSISPLLANIALHGMETCIAEAFPSYENRRIKGSKKNYGHWIQAPSVIRYADDFIILCEELSIVQDCQEIISKWLKDIGLELKPSKTRLTHTLKEHNAEKPGFDFLGFSIRQFPKGKHHSGKHLGEILGHKTIVKPSPEKIQTHYETIANWCDRLKGESQVALISQLNPIIRGWCNYQSPWNSKEAFSKLEHLVWNRLWRWAKRRHPTKGRKWIARKYWQTINGNRWTFATRGENPMSLLKYPTFKAGDIWTKVQGSRTPLDGDWVYWSERIGEKYKVLDTQKARLIQRQKGKCANCGHHFQPDDNLEKHHLILQRKGGKNADNNMVLLHLHCHDQIHALAEQEYETWVESKTTEIAMTNT